MDQQQQLQNVVVMRHGDRIDILEPMWAMTAARCWDPPLSEAGKTRAFCTGKKLRRHSIGFPIHRVFVSPFLRCLQSASEIISALCAVDDDPHVVNSVGVADDLSKIKASVEYGLCEMLNKQAMRLEMAPKDENFGFDFAECESKLPIGTVDQNVERVYNELPKWEESEGVARTRFIQVIKSLANKYPLENLLLITHGEGVGVSVSAFTPNCTTKFKTDFCGYSQLQRPITFGENNSIIADGDFELVSGKGQTGYYPRRARRITNHLL